MHKAVQHPAAPGRIYLQHHGGVYRSDDAGGSWKNIGKGLPSDFGFALAVDPHDGDTAFVLPLESDMFRCTPEGKLRVYRTTDGGKSWRGLGKGLPQENALETVLRDAMDADACDPAGVYFGTKSGRVYGSRDRGDSWRELVAGLPPVCCVKAALVPGAAKAAARGKAKGRRR